MKHYVYLQNNTVFCGLGSVGKGTMTNEAVHKQMKMWGAGVLQQHADRAATVGRVFGLYKVLAARENRSNLSENRALAVIAGHIAANGLAKQMPSGERTLTCPPPGKATASLQRAPKMAWKRELAARAEKKKAKAAKTEAGRH